MLGGGMRQAGVLAAAGLLALEEGPPLLARDHENAAWLAGELAEISGLSIDPEAVATNIVMVRVTAELFGGDEPEGGLAAGFLAAAREEGILAVPVGPDLVRLVTHRDAPRERIEPAFERLRSRFDA
jgi:threonine aldolase